jgi:hypothetical protein
MVGGNPVEFAEGFGVSEHSADTFADAPDGQSGLGFGVIGDGQDPHHVSVAAGGVGGNGNRAGEKAAKESGHEFQRPLGRIQQQ